MTSNSNDPHIRQFDNSRIKPCPLVRNIFNYNTYMVLAATQSDIARNLSTMMIFVIPVTAVTLLVTVLQSIRSRSW